MVNKGRPRLIIAELFNLFTSSKTGRKLKSPKGNNEMWINKFFKLLHNKLLRYHLYGDFDVRFSEFFSYIEGYSKKESLYNPNEDDFSKKYLFTILGCRLWPKSFFKNAAKEIFTNYDKNKCKLTIECCKLLRNMIPDFQEVINVFARCLLGKAEGKNFNESFLNSVFNQECDSIYDKDIRKKIWKSLIIDHLSYIGADTENQLGVCRIKKLLNKLADVKGDCNKDPYSYETSIEASWYPSTTDIQTDPQGNSRARESKNSNFGFILQEKTRFPNKEIEDSIGNFNEFLFCDSSNKEISNQISFNEKPDEFMIEKNDFKHNEIIKKEIFIENEVNSSNINSEGYISGGDMSEDYFELI